MSQTITIPSAFVKVISGKLEANPDLLKNPNFHKLFSDPSKEYNLTVLNKREWIKIPTSVLFNLNTIGTLNFNLPNCKHIDWRVFDFWHYPNPKSEIIPCHKINITTDGYLNISMPSNKKDIRESNISPLEELNMKANQFNIRMAGFKNLKKVKLEFNELRLATITKDSWFFNSFVFRDCQQLKEIDLTSFKNIAKEAHIHLHIDFDNIPDDCKIKFDSSILKSISSAHIYLCKNKRLNIYLENLESHYLQGETIFSTKNIFKEYSDLTGPIEISFEDLKKKIVEQHNKHTSSRKVGQEKTTSTNTDNLYVR